MRVIAFDPIHVMLNPHRLSERDIPFSTHEYVSRLPEFGPAYSALIKGQVYLCGGIAMEPDTQKRWLWSFLMIDAGPHLLTLTRGLRRMFYVHPGKLFAAACPEYAPAGRWLAILGFTPTDDVDVYGNVVFERD